MRVPQSVPTKYAARVEHWDDERAIGNSLIVMLKDGWHWPQDSEGCHTYGFDTVAEAVRGLRKTAPCHCGDCIKTEGK